MLDGIHGIAAREFLENNLGRSALATEAATTGA